MKTSVVVIFVLVTVGASVYGLPAKTTLKKPDCFKDCGDVYKPICVGDGTGKGNKSFGSECVLQNYNCENKANWKVVSQGECPGGSGVRLS